MTTGRETLNAKAVRLLAEGRVQIRFASEGVIAAAVRGDSSIYDVRWSRDQGWGCSCPAQRRCSHAQAVARVTVRSVATA